LIFNIDVARAPFEFHVLFIKRVSPSAPVPENLCNEEATLLEPLACCLNGFSRLGEIEKDGVIAIVGDGPIGLLHLQLSKKLYNMRSIVVGKIPFRMQMAERMGADAVFTFGNGTEEDVSDFTSGRGADVVIVATSNPEALNFATKIAAKNSKVNLFSSFSNCKYVDVLDAVSLDIPLGIIPQENTTFGTVVETTDLLRLPVVGREKFIVGETAIAISHCLVVRKGVKAEDIDVLLSHEQVGGFTTSTSAPNCLIFLL